MGCLLSIMLVHWTQCNIWKHFMKKIIYWDRWIWIVFNSMNPGSLFNHSNSFRGRISAFQANLGAYSPWIQFSQNTVCKLNHFCQIASRTRNRFPVYSKWSDNFRTYLVFFYILYSKSILFHHEYKIDTSVDHKVFIWPRYFSWLCLYS